MKSVISTYYFVFFVGMASTSPFLSLYLNGKGINNTQIGLLLAGGAAIATLAQPILGLITDRLRDQRRVLLVSVILSPIIFAGYALFRNFFALLLVACLLAAVQATSPLLDSIAVTQGEKSGFTYGQVRLWGALGFALAAVAAGYIYHRTGIGAAFIIYGLLSVLLVGITFYLPKTASKARNRDPFMASMRRMAHQRTLIVFIVICFICSMASAINYTFLPLYYQDLHYPMSWVGLNFTVAALVEVPLFYVSGKLMERYGLVPTVITGSICYTVKYAIMAAAPGAVAVIGIQALDGMAYALYWSAAVQLVADLAPADGKATAQTVFGAVAGSLSGIVGTIVGGFVLDTDGPLMMYLVTTILSALATIGFIVFAKFFRQPSKSTRIKPHHTANTTTSERPF